MDTQGWLLLLKVLPANQQDRDGGEQLLERLKQRYGWLSKIWADGGYAGKFETWVANLKRHRRIHLDIVKRNQPVSSFKVLPNRWIVERTFAWLGNSRRLVRDYEKRLDHSESIIGISMAKRMLATFA